MEYGIETSLKLDSVLNNLSLKIVAVILNRHRMAVLFDEKGVSKSPSNELTGAFWYTA